MDVEYLPATGTAQQELVLLHGWGSDREIWRPLLAALRPWANLTLVDIPGCAPVCATDQEQQLPDVLGDLLARCPPRAVFLGWSLGGQLAIEIANRQPQRVLGIITLCSNPRFIGEADWPGMDRSEFETFAGTVARSPVTGLRRFAGLQAGSSRQALRLLRRFSAQPLTREDGEYLLMGLGWLRELDQRAILPALDGPQLHLLGGRDALVPTAVEGALRTLLCAVPAARVRLLPEAGHLAPLEASAELAGEIRAFLDSTRLLPEAAGEPCSGIAKAEVAQSFSRAASRYDSVASLQRDVGGQLLHRLDSLGQQPGTVLDLGCGTGYFCPALRERYPGADYIGLDLAQGMVEFARQRCPGERQWLVGDAEALPLASNSVDLVFSSLAIQWCDRPRLLFAELARVLRPGGHCVFTSLGPQTLVELRDAWAAVDARQHVNTFLPPSALADAAGDVPGLSLALDGARFNMQYERVRELLDELKTLGAHNMNRDRPAGLTSRRTLQGMLQAYEKWRRDGLLPATYDVIFGVLEAA